MTTQYVNFTPNATSVFQFQGVFDGNTCSITVLWGLFGQRWYVQLKDISGSLVFYLPMIGSSTSIATSSIVWNSTTRLVTITTTVPHLIKVGSITKLTLYGAQPVTFNGIFYMVATSPTTLTYKLSVDPGISIEIINNPVSDDVTLSITQGFISYDINIVGGYFTNTSLVFRQQTQQFEISDIPVPLVPLITVTPSTPNSFTPIITPAPPSPFASLTRIFDTNYYTLVTDTMILYELLTASRTVTLIPAASVPAGYIILICDGTGNCSPTNSLVIVPTGTDMIGGFFSLTLNSAYATLTLVSDGASRWFLES